MANQVLGEVRLLGIEQALKNFKQLSIKIAGQIARKAVRAATQKIADQVKATTYGGGRQERTGRLQKSIGVSVSKTKDGYKGKVVSRAVALAKGDKKNNAFYWRFLEKGTADRYLKSRRYAWKFTARGNRGYWRKHSVGHGAFRGKVTPRPWVEPAFDSTSNAAIDEFVTVFKRETETEAQSLNTQPPKRS